jgi:8-oxo-dGTP diphosphatase
MSLYDPNAVHIKNFFLLGVKLILVNENNEILLLKRSAKSSNAHSWDFPGGAVDSGETFENAVERELYEETTLSLANIQPLGSVHILEGEDEAMIMGYSAKALSTDVALSWEHESYRWVSVDEIESIELRELHAQMYEFYKSRVLS